MICVKTRLLNVWQSNYTYTEKNKIFLLTTSWKFIKLSCTLKMWLKVEIFFYQLVAVLSAAKGNKT